MKKAMLVVLVVVVALAMVTGCKDEDEPAASTVKGEAFEASWVNLLVPEGWDIADFPDTRQINMQKTGTQMYVLFKLERDSVRNAEEAIDKFVADYESYKTTPTESVKFGTTDFYKTTYDLGGPQTILKADIGTWDTGTANDGHWRATVTLQGKDHDTDEAVKAILDSLVFKAPE